MSTLSKNAEARLAQDFYFHLVRRQLHTSTKDGWLIQWQPVKRVDRSSPFASTSNEISNYPWSYRHAD